MRDDKLKELTAEIARLTGEVQGLREQKKRLDNVQTLEREIETLKREKSQLEIDTEKIKETHAREKREVEHLVGLEKKRQDFEIEAGKREATLQVREEALTGKQEAFTERMDFMTKHMEKENKYVREIMEQILARLPDVNVALGGGDFEADE